jgi:hypothetical protein
MESLNIKNVSEALVKAQGSFPVIPFDKTNPHFKSRFSSLTAIMNHTKKILSDNGLAVTHSIKDMILYTRLVHISGEYLESEIPLTLSKHDMQGLGSAVTYAKRYGVSAILNLVTDEDDDANAAVTTPPATKPIAEADSAPKNPPPNKNAPATPKLGVSPKKPVPKWNDPPADVPLAPAFDEFKPAFDTSFNFGANEDNKL